MNQFIAVLLLLTIGATMAAGFWLRDRYGPATGTLALGAVVILEVYTLVWALSLVPH